MNPEFQSLSVLGCGNMGGALVKGMVASGSWDPSQIFVYDSNPEVSRQLAEELKVKHCGSLKELAEASPQIIAAVKPQVFPDMDLEPLQKNTRVLISIMAGLTVGKLRELLGETVCIVRTMPNLPLSVNQGVTAIAVDDLSPEIVAGAEQIFAAVGSSVRVSESQLDAVTGLSGSGPMYVFEFIAGLIQAGVDEGLGPESARRLALKTVKGAAALLESSKDSPADWTKKVCSPGGTTLAALEKLEAAGFKDIIKSAVSAAADRSRELGQ